MGLCILLFFILMLSILGLIASEHNYDLMGLNFASGLILVISATSLFFALVFAPSEPDVKGFEKNYEATWATIDAYFQADSVEVMGVTTLQKDMEGLNEQIDRNRKYCDDVMFNWYASEDIAVHPKFDIDLILGKINTCTTRPLITAYKAEVEKAKKTL